MSQLVRWRMYDMGDLQEGSKCSIVRVYLWSCRAYWAGLSHGLEGNAHGVQLARFKHYRFRQNISQQSPIDLSTIYVMILAITEVPWNRVVM